MKVKFSQKLQDIIYAVADDEILTMAIADYIDKRADNAITVLDSITSLLNGEESDDISGCVLFNDVENDKICTVKISELQRAAKAEPTINEDTGEAELLFTDVDGNQYSIDDYVEQTGESVNSLRVISESLRLAYNSRNQEFAENSANFKSRLEMRMGALSDNASALGYKVNEVISDSKISIRSKLGQLLQFLGLKPISEKSSPIGIPETDFSQYYESNVWCAWGADLVDRSENFFDGCWNVVKDVFSVLGDIANSVLGGIFNKVGDVILTTLGFTDSFRPSDNYSDLSFSDFGYCGCLDFDYLNPHNNPLIEDTDLVELINTLIDDYNIHGLDDPRSSGLDRTKLYDSVKYWFYTFSYDEPDWNNLNPDDTILGGLKGVYRLYQMYALGLTVDQTDDLSDVTSLRDVIRIIFNEYNNLNFSSQSLLQQHLSEYSYVKMCLPYGYAYLWLSEDHSKVYFKLYTIPVKDVPFAYTDAVSAFDITKIGADTDAFGNLLFNVGLSNYANGVTQMSDWYDWAARDAIMNAHLVNSLFLIYVAVATGHKKWHFQGQAITVTNWESFLLMAWGLEKYMYGDYAFNYADTLTNQSWITYNLGNTDATITNIKLAKYLGATQDGSIRINAGEPLLYVLDILSYTMFGDNLEYWNFYVHTNDTPHGLWHVMSDAELASYCTTVIKTAAVIYGSIKLIKLMKKLKKASYTAQGKADLLLFSAMNETTGVIDDGVINQAFKAQKKANILSIIQTTLFGTVKNIVSGLGATLVSIPGSIYRSIKNTIIERNGVQSDGINAHSDVNMNTIYRVITGSVNN